MPHSLLLLCLFALCLGVPLGLRWWFRHWHIEDSYHLELLANTGAKRVYLLRYFSGPVGPLDRKTGQPYRRFNGSCILSLDTDSKLCEVKGILWVPKKAFWKLRGPIRAEIGARAFWGERWPDKGPKRMLFVPLLIFAALIVLPLLTGCNALRRPQIRTADGASVLGVPDAGKPATLTSGEARSGFRVPAKSTLTITRTEPQPATPTEAARPATEVSVWDFSEPTEFESVARTLQADTGTVDTSVAKHRIDVAERRWLLWVAIAGGFAGLIVRSMLPQWPALSNGLLIGAALAFGAWKLAEIPTWLWAAALGVSALLILGYKRAEWDRNGDGIPDILQKQKPPAPSAQ